MTASPEDATVRFVVPAGYDASDSSDGIPAFSEVADSEVIPASVPEPVLAAEPTRRLPSLTLGETFSILWALECAARTAKVDVEAEPMPAVEPTGVHLWSADHRSLCIWLERERQREWVCVAIDRVLPEDKLEAGRFFLESLATGMPLARVIEVGPRRFVHLAFRSGEG